MLDATSPSRSTNPSPSRTEAAQSTTEAFKGLLLLLMLLLFCCRGEGVSVVVLPDRRPNFVGVELVKLAPPPIPPGPAGEDAESICICPCSCSISICLALASACAARASASRIRRSAAAATSSACWRARAPSSSAFSTRCLSSSINLADSSAAVAAAAAAFPVVALAALPAVGVSARPPCGCSTRCTFLSPCLASSHCSCSVAAANTAALPFGSTTSTSKSCHDGPCMPDRLLA